jgi:tetratricopeptide (TPR) repeat protein
MAATTALQRQRRQQILREAEGYLDLVMALGTQCPLDPQARDVVATRALATLERLDAHSASRPEALYLKGQAMRCMERWAEAVAALNEAAGAEPENVHIWLALGWCYKRMNRLDLAIQALEEALEVDPSMAIIHYNLACYWSLARNAERAVDCLQQAFEIDPNYRDTAVTESDFDPIRADPRFQEVMSVIV